jgi:hypothetical protein
MAGGWMSGGWIGLISHGSGPHVPDLGGEILGRGEGAVHRGEPQVGNLVQIAERPEDGEPDVLALDLCLT